MSKEILLNPEMLYNWDFKVDARGYRPQEVDKVLDMVISDYNAYNSMIREKDRQIDALNNQILEHFSCRAVQTIFNPDNRIYDCIK